MIKFRLFLALAAALCFEGASLAWQDVKWTVNASSNIVGASATGLQRIPNSNPGDIISSLIINDCATGSGVFTLYDSSGSATTNSLGGIDLSTTPAGNGANTSECHYQLNYFLRVSTGIGYTNTATGVNVTILWYNDFGNDQMDSDTDP